MRTFLAFAGVTATLVMTAAVPAHADVVTTIPLAGGQAPVTAAGSGVQDCTALGARRGLDSWRFTLPSDRFNFAGVTARFAPRRDARIATFVATAPGPRGTAAGKRATFTTPRGLWLIGASATVRGKGKKPTQFRLASTCAAPVAARPGPDTVVNPPAQPPAAAYPTDYPSEYPSASPSVTPEPWPSETALEPEEEAASPSESTESEGLVTRGDTGDDGIPPIAMALVATLLAAGLLASVGVLFAAARRRRTATDPTVTTPTIA